MNFDDIKLIDIFLDEVFLFMFYIFVFTLKVLVRIFKKTTTTNV